MTKPYFDPIEPRPHVVTWNNGKPTVTVTCEKGHTVNVEGVTTVEGALAVLERAGQHQH